MSNQAVFTKIGDWKKLESTFSGIEAKMRARIKLATMKVAALLVKKMKDGIRKHGGTPDGKFKSKSPLTLHLAVAKGEGSARANKPLIQHGDLVNAITKKMMNEWEFFAGVLRGTEKHNVAAILEAGGVINVTPKMRLYLASLGVPLSPTTSVIVIPPRPFTDPWVQDKEFQLQVKDIYTDALQDIFSGRALA